jgi:hypothetical protein
MGAGGAAFQQAGQVAPGTLEQVRPHHGAVRRGGFSHQVHGNHIRTAVDEGVEGLGLAEQVRAEVDARDAGASGGGDDPEELGVVQRIASASESKRRVGTSGGQFRAEALGERQAHHRPLRMVAVGPRPADAAGATAGAEFQDKFLGRLGEAPGGGERDGLDDRAARGVEDGVAERRQSAGKGGGSR